MAIPDSFQTQSGKFDARILDQLACPVCLGALQKASSGLQIRCLTCQRLYPLMDGIPVLIPERAEDSQGTSGD